MDAAEYLRHSRLHFEAIRRKAERALAQVDDAQFFTALDPESNSLALIVKHLAGNLRSRWTDFLTTDGEKPDRARDTEFEHDAASDTRESLRRRWDAGWAALFGALDSLTPADLGRDVTIRSEPLSVFHAIERQKEHYAYHVGQIVFLAKHLAGPTWTSLSVPRGRSEQFHAEMKAAGAKRGFR
jgi:uncharacterized protein DUF1572